MKSCKEWMDLKRSRGESIHPFCDKVKKDPLQTECTENRDSVALCNLREYEHEVEMKFQNFDAIPSVKNESLAFYGGSVALADYCPYIQEFTWKLNDEIVRGSKCSFSENNPQPEKNFALEQYGANSKCFNHNNEMWEERSCFEVGLFLSTLKLLLTLGFLISYRFDSGNIGAQDAIRLEEWSPTCFLN